MSQNNLQETIEEIIEANIYEAQKGMRNAPVFPALIALASQPVAGVGESRV